MANPKDIWVLGNITGNQAKTVAIKSVIQEITLFNQSGSSITFTVYRTPVADTADKYQAKNRIRASVTVASGSSVTLSNLKWVLGVGDSISFQPSSSGLSYNIFVDGVEFN